MENKKEIIENIIAIKKATGSKISDCRQALEKFSGKVDEAISFLLSRPISNEKIRKTDNLLSVCKTDFLFDNNFVFLHFLAQTDFVCNMLKKSSLKELFSVDQTEQIIKENQINNDIKSDLENRMFLLTKENIILKNYVLFNTEKQKIIFYNNLNAKSSCVVLYTFNIKQEENNKSFQYKVLHTSVTLPLSSVENVLKNFCVSANCLTIEEVKRINDYLSSKEENDIKDILDVFSEKPIINQISYLKKQDCIISKIYKFEV